MFLDLDWCLAVKILSEIVSKTSSPGACVLLFGSPEYKSGVAQKGEEYSLESQYLSSLKDRISSSYRWNFRLSWEKLYRCKGGREHS